MSKAGKQKKDDIAKLLEQIYRRCAFVIYGHLLAILRDERDAWDLTQESFIGLMAELQRGRQVEHPLRYLMKTANHLAWKTRRRRPREPELWADQPEIAVGPDWYKHEAERAFERLWPLLDVRLRTLAKFYLLDEMNEGELRVFCGFRHGKLRRMISRIKKIALKNNLMQFFFKNPRS